MNDISPLQDLIDTLVDGAALPAALAGPFVRGGRCHPRRGRPTEWCDRAPIPWHARGFSHHDPRNPAAHLDYHTGCVYPQDPASQLPVVVLDPRPGEVVIDACAAPGSKTGQIGLALGDAGLVVAGDPAPARRKILVENLARQGIACAVVTPLPLPRLAQLWSGAADAVLVDAPCSGHTARSQRQVARMAVRQQGILAHAAALVRPGGRLVYSTCTPYRVENEAVIAAFLARHPDWSLWPATAPGVDGDLDAGGGLRLWPHRHGCEPFFCARLRRAGSDERRDPPPAGRLPLADPWLDAYLPDTDLHCWRHGRLILAATPRAASCPLPAQARGMLLAEGTHAHLLPWGAQALIARGVPATIVGHDQACRLWAGDTLDRPAEPAALVATDAGAPLGQLDDAGTGLRLASRLRRTGLV